jgi:hypothetical protein
MNNMRFVWLKVVGKVTGWWPERMGRRLGFFKEDRSFVICLLKKEKKNQNMKIRKNVSREK